MQKTPEGNPPIEQTTTERNPQQNETWFAKHIKKMRDSQEKTNTLGKGSKKLVLQNKTNPEQAIGIFHHTDMDNKEKEARQAKKRFYINKILHLLFPENIPDIHLATSQPKTIIVDKISGEEVEKYHILSRAKALIIIHKLSKLGVLVDQALFNFMKSKNGVFYIDDFYHACVTENRNFLKAIDKLEPAKRELALKYLERLRTAGEN
jgi:hypothetical protein